MPGAPVKPGTKLVNGNNGNAPGATTASTNINIDGTWVAKCFPGSPDDGAPYVTRTIVATGGYMTYNVKYFSDTGCKTSAGDDSNSDSFYAVSADASQATRLNNPLFGYRVDWFSTSDGSAQGSEAMVIQSNAIPYLVFESTNNMYTKQ